MTEGVEWGTVAQWAGACVAFLAFVVSIRAMMNKPNQERLEEIKTSLSNIDERMRNEDARIFNRLDAVESRCSSIEAELRHLPSKDAMHNLEKALLKMEGKIDVISAKVEPIKAISERIQENMMEHGK